MLLKNCIYPDRPAHQGENVGLLWLKAVAAPEAWRTSQRLEKPEEEPLHLSTLRAKRPAQLAVALPGMFGKHRPRLIRERRQETSWVRQAERGRRQ